MHGLPLPILVELAPLQLVSCRHLLLNKMQALIKQPILANANQPEANCLTAQQMQQITVAY